MKWKLKTNCKIGNSNAEKKEVFWSLFTEINWNSTKISLIFIELVSILYFLKLFYLEYPELVYSSDDDNAGNKRKKQNI
jgi:hypothetical protein